MNLWENKERLNMWGSANTPSPPIWAYFLVFNSPNPLQMASSIIVFSTALVILTSLLVQLFFSFLAFFFFFFNGIFYGKMFLTFALIFFFSFTFHFCSCSIISRRWGIQNWIWSRLLKVYVLPLKVLYHFVLSVGFSVEI